MSIIEDWYSLNGTEEGKVEELQKKVDGFSLEIQELKGTITQLVDELRAQQASQRILLEELKQLRSASESTEHLKKSILEELKGMRSTSDIQQTRDLLEELKVMKQRELNLLLREKIPVPFFASTETLLTKKILL
jgi:septation ring formation regulator EzrA